MSGSEKFDGMVVVMENVNVRLKGFSFPASGDTICEDDSWSTNTVTKKSREILNLANG